MSLEIDSTQYVGQHRPEIDVTALTERGRLQPEQYRIAASYVEFGSVAASALPEGHDLARRIMDELLTFIWRLPRDDAYDLNAKAISTLLDQRRMRDDSH